MLWSLSSRLSLYHAQLARRVRKEENACSKTRRSDSARQIHKDKRLRGLCGFVCGACVKRESRRVTLMKSAGSAIMVTLDLLGFGLALILLARLGLI
jgi:hypothetical protein